MSNVIMKKSGRMRWKDHAAFISIVLNVILCMSLMASKQVRTPALVMGKQVEWHGGHPTEARPGSCWCGHSDKYCMCTPNLAIDLIITSGRDHVWLVRRKDTNQLATMGGFVDMNESVEQAVGRELMEEMGLHLTESPKLFGVYTDPRRDNRRRTASVVFAVELPTNIQPHAGDDVKDVQRIPLADIEKHSFFCDHRTILMDYRKSIQSPGNGASSQGSYGDFAEDIKRTTCFEGDQN